jgi:hypothetical protein
MECPICQDLHPDPICSQVANQRATANERELARMEKTAAIGDD